MDPQEQDTAPLRAPSQETLGPRGVPRGPCSNSRAFKVASLTVLACLLLSSQALMAYMVFSHRAQIDSLQRSTDKILKLSSRTPAAPGARRELPMMSMPLGDLMMGVPPKDAPPKKTPLVKLQNTAMVTLERQVKDLLQDFHLPQFNETFQANLKSLKTQMEENEWKGLETWMRNWLIFQTAQQKPRTSEPAPSLQTKCNLLRQQASTGPTVIGVYRPQCDAQGQYEPTQCWHSTGFCWCVDGDGNIIPETMIRGRPSCGGASTALDRAPVFRSLVAHPNTQLLEPLLTDE